MIVAPNAGSQIAPRRKATDVGCALDRHRHAIAAGATKLRGAATTRGVARRGDKRDGGSRIDRAQHVKATTQPQPVGHARIAHATAAAASEETPTTPEAKAAADRR